MRRLCLCLLLPLCALAQTTHSERSGFRETPRLAETLADCRELAARSPWFRLTEFGRSPQGRPLALLILDRDRQFQPAARSTGKAVLLIQACIHAGEPDGKDAGLLFLRDLVTRQPELLEGLTILFLPVFNADGHERFGPHNRINQNGPAEMGWRSNARNLNLNRDYLKADTAEMRAWLQVARDWQPDFVVDCHLTDGADYQYPITYGIDNTVEKSALSGGDWFKYDPSRPARFQIPYFKALKATASVRLPAAYLIPAEWTEVIARLEARRSGPADPVRGGQGRGPGLRGQSGGDPELVLPALPVPRPQPEPLPRRADPRRERGPGVAAEIGQPGLCPRIQISLKLGS